MKISDIAFAATLCSMLIASIVAIGTLGGHARSDADLGIPVLKLEPVVITGTKGSASISGLKREDTQQPAS